MRGFTIHFQRMIRFLFHMYRCRKLGIVFLAVGFMLFFPSISQADSRGSIQGYKTVVEGDGDISLIQQLAVFVDGETVLTTNPFIFESVSSRDHKVSVTVPSGYIVGYTVCRNSIDCHNQAPIPGSSVEVSVPKNGFVDVWWHFKRDAAIFKGYAETASVIDRFDAWDYAPSIVVLPDNPAQARLFWCSADKNLQGRTSDSIFSVGYDVAARKVVGETVKVIAPSESGWDSYHTCDPSVVAGKFSSNGVAYAYALYYTATERAGIENHIGVAFSNDLLTWVKYPDYVIQPESLSGKSYGAGQSSVVNRDGTVFLFYLDRSRGVQKMLFRTTQDGVHFSDAQLTSMKGLEGLSIDAPAFAYDSELNKWFMTTGIFEGSRPCGGRPARFPYTSVHTYTTDDFQTGDWKEIGSIGGGEHNLIMNHNPEFLTDVYGNLSRFHSSIPTFYGHGFCFDIDSWSLQVSDGSFVWTAPSEESVAVPMQETMAEKIDVPVAYASQTSIVDITSTDPRSSFCSDQKEYRTSLYPVNMAGILKLAFNRVRSFFVCSDGM